MDSVEMGVKQKNGASQVEAPPALLVDLPGSMSGGEEPLSYTLAPPTAIPETSKG
jgi:hypothetical protein